MFFLDFQLDLLLLREPVPPATDPRRTVQRDVQRWSHWALPEPLLRI